MTARGARTAITAVQLGARTAITAVALGAVLLTACGGDAQSARVMQGPPPPVVEAATVERIDVEEALSLVGQLEPWESVMMHPETEGVVETIGFRDGDEVAKGQVLFELRDDEQQARLREAEAQVVLSERALKRASSLAGERIMAAAELDEATAQRNAARARLDLARVQLDRMTIRAPFDGVAGHRMVSPGDRVNDDTDLVRIDAVASLRVAFAVPEPIVDSVRVGMPLVVGVVAYPQEQFPGSVYFVAPSLDPQSRHLLLKGEIANAGRRLRPGMFANIRLATESRVEVLAAPESAVVADPAGPYVFRIAEDGTAQRVPVELGIRREGKVEIKSGLAEGDRVVSAGTNKVAHGRPVQVAGAPAPGGAAAAGGDGVADGSAGEGAATAAESAAGKRGS